MPKFSYDLEISAASQQEADVKTEALRVLLSRLSAKELDKLAHIIQYEPETMSIAKGFLGL